MPQETTARVKIATSTRSLP